jgi:hypothetical protein
MFALLALLPACGGGSGSSPPPPTAVTVKVGGTVAGLSGSLVLRNNGVDDLSLGADGLFTFATALATGAAYAVTVATQPSGQTCSVTHGTGTTGSTDITDVAIACSNTAAGGSGTPDLSFGTGGKVITDFSGPPPAPI